MHSPHVILHDFQLSSIAYFCFVCLIVLNQVENVVTFISAYILSKSHIRDYKILTAGP